MSVLHGTDAPERASPRKGTQNINHGLNLLGEKSTRIGKYLREKKHPKRESRSNYPKAMLIVTTFQAETAIKDRSADRLRQLSVWIPRGLLVGRGRPFQASSFFLVSPQVINQLNLYKRKKCKSINKYKELGPKSCLCTKMCSGQAGERQLWLAINTHEGLYVPLVTTLPSPCS